MILWLYVASLGLLGIFGLWYGFWLYFIILVRGFLLLQYYDFLVVLNFCLFGL